MSARVISLLDRPTYTYPQVDRLLGLTKGTAQRWLNGYRSGEKSYDPVQRMRRAIEVLREEIDADYPLARGFLYLEPKGRELLLKAQAIAGMPEQFAMLTRRGQIQLAPWVYEVVESADTDDNPLRDVVRLRVAPEFPDLHWDPRRRGGQPTVGDSNVLATTVAEFVMAGEPAGEVASWYHLTEEQVDQAVRYRHIHTPAA